MKRFLFLFVLFFILSKVYAIEYEYNYSEWSEEYPNGVDNIFIQSENRYNCYKNKITNEEYLKREDIGNKEVNYDDYILGNESELYDEKPIETEDIIVYEKKVTKNYTINDVKGILLDNFNNPDNYGDFYYIKIVDSLENKINVNEYEQYKGVLDGYATIDFKNDIKFTFVNDVDVNNIVLSLYYELDDLYTTFDISYIAEDGYRIFTYKASIIGENMLTLEGINDFESHFERSVTKYTYKDKLYKTYNIVKENDGIYHNLNDDCDIIDETKKSFYRYITNDYVIVNSSGKLVTSSNQCIKSYCFKVYANKKEEPKKEITINPSTGDSLYYYLILFILSMLFIVLFRKQIINLVLSNRFKIN